MTARAIYANRSYAITTDQALAQYGCCLYCEGWLEPEREWERFCSSACRDAHFRRVGALALVQSGRPSSNAELQKMALREALERTAS